MVSLKNPSLISVHGISVLKEGGPAAEASEKGALLGRAEGKGKA